MTAPSRNAPSALVVGTGFGCRIHVPALRAAGFHVAALVGTDPERTARRAQTTGVEQVFTNLEEAILKTGAVAVTIATPPSTHADLALIAISHGCHVICEKPMAGNSTEAQAMLVAAARAGVTHLVGNEFRWQPERAIIARAIAEGLIGTPRLLTLAGYLPLVAPPEAKMARWWFDQNAGGGWLGAQGAHLIDQVHVWAGEFASLSAALSSVSDRPPLGETHNAEDSYVVRFRLRNGAEGVIQQTAGAWGPATSLSRIAGTGGTLWTEDTSVRLANSEGVRQLPVPEDLVLPAPPSGSGNARHSAELGPYIRLCEVLHAGVEGRSTPCAVPPPTFKDGWTCMKVLDAIRQSAAAGGALVELS